jgi:hypothetical protein
MDFNKQAAKAAVWLLGSALRPASLNLGRFAR